MKMKIGLVHLFIGISYPEEFEGEIELQMLTVIKKSDGGSAFFLWSHPHPHRPYVCFTLIFLTINSCLHL